VRDDRSVEGKTSPSPRIKDAARVDTLLVKAEGSRSCGG